MVEPSLYPSVVAISCSCNLSAQHPLIQHTCGALVEVNSKNVPLSYGMCAHVSSSAAVAKSKQANRKHLSFHSVLPFPLTTRS